ncbi:ArsC/Spx/MgsR family protein [Olleya sp. HaHaR_3_96]|uniref:ArsC/Spx/MgsR family protein n=1 Tax=Olleya sp. HaHaR_3_96 TaxID=2745560 RepID=UPI001C4FB047|nr:ArsC/Spx/MgsR family protein [Olleya sp. HaHaR_3_96]QXP59056.1 arsenate reductase [Olleya sp. HaHaR_3_96]
MIIIYHNPESSNSNACLEILETHKNDQELIKYQDKPLDKIKLTKIINLLNIKPIELIRTENKTWKDNFKHLEDDGHEFSDASLIDVMIEYQDIIERPIVINGEKAVIGEPAKRIFNIKPQHKASL